MVEECDTNSIVIKETLYTTDGTVEHAYTVTTEYNENDPLAATKKYADKTLVEENFYTNIDGYGYCSKTIVYHKDGTQTVTEYDEFGEVIE